MSEASRFLLADRPTIVSGLPRSGTSLLMQMLEVAGLALARDDARPPDPDNPRGYHELTAVKRLNRDAAFLADCRGRVVKIVAPLLLAVPPDAIGRVLFVERDLDEVLASQRAMLERSGASRPPADDEGLRRAFASAHEKTRAWLVRSGAPPVLFVEHRRLIDAPAESARRIARFLEGTARPDPEATPSAPIASLAPAAARASAVPEEGLIHAMAAVVDPALHRQRPTASPRRRPAHSP